MKTKIKKEKDFDAVKSFRAIKEKISEEISGMTFEELKVYLESRQLKPPRSQ